MVAHRATAALCAQARAAAQRRSARDPERHPLHGALGRRRSVDLREILNAIRYIARSGGGWRMLPKDFPPWQTVYWWFRRFVRLLLFRTIHDVG